MAITSSSPIWKKYTQHVLRWEGKTSSDPRDTAASCYPGGIHTNKGVTFCTFKQLAAKIGITPVTHARFLKMTDDEVGRFIFEYYKNIRGSELPNSVAVAMTEAAWGSGQGRAFKHLRDSLSDLGRPVISNSQAIQAAAQVPEKRLFDAYFNQRLNYLANTLGSQTKYAMFRRGWINRQNAFKALFTGVPILLPLFFLGILAAGIIKNS